MPAAWTTESRPPMVVAAVGHAWLRDQAFGLKVLERVRAVGPGPEVVLADWSFGSIAAFQRLTERPYARAIFVCGVERGRPPGTIYRLSPPDQLPPPEEIHARIADCAMGCVSLDHLLVMARFYEQLPADTVVVEAEPADQSWGGDLSPALAARLDEAVGWVMEELARPLPHPEAREVEAKRRGRITPPGARHRAER